MPEAIHVEGLAGLQRAFKEADRAMSRSLRSTLREVVEPVRADAERLAIAEIRRIGIPWSRMRVGITANAVYIAPQQRGGRGPRRPNLAPLLLASMEEALDRDRQEVIDGFESMINLAELAWGRAIG